jgi:hypothetical protein
MHPGTIDLHSTVFLMHMEEGMGFGVDHETVE